MKRLILALGILLCCGTASAQTRYDYPSMQTERLGRGVVAVRKSPSEVFVSWRYLSQDSPGTTFDVYRDGVKLTRKPISDVTYFVDAKPLGSDATYEVVPMERRRPTSAPRGSFTLAADAPEGYIPIALDIPAPSFMPAGGQGVYSPNDCSVGDVDGDGEYEIFLKWDPSNAKDNSQAGYTGEVYIDCLKLSGERLWRINLGRNIRAGAHYTQFIVYDLDGDGCAEMVCKTSDATVDGTGKVIGDPYADYREHNLRYTGHIKKGNEYLTVFNGRTGAAMATVDYVPERGEDGSWGDVKANRGERYLAALAFLDGKHPSVVMCRGYYIRATLAAWDWDGKELKLRWLFDSHSDPSLEGYDNQGNHNLRVADVDGDGRDEIVYGSCCIDDDGTGLYTNGLGHGDAMHIGQMIPGSDRLQVWIGHENKGIGSALVDAATGEVIWRLPANTDVGRSMAADIDPTNPGWEMWSSASAGLRNWKGEVIGEQPRSVNFAVWWDGDLSRELLDANRIDKFDPDTRKIVNIKTFEGARSNNGTKSTPALSGDILGDWREEVLLRSEDNKELRLYVSTEPTSYRFHTFLEDPVYRTSIAAENVCYNQPPETGFYFGEDMFKTFAPAEIEYGVILDSLRFPEAPPRPQVQQPAEGPDSATLALTARPVSGSSRKGRNPVLFLVGDSTMRTGTRGNGDNGQWGWGYYAADWFDTDRISVENHALGGLSIRTFYRGWWPDVLKGIRKGDYVIIQLGHNDSGPWDSPFGRSSIPGTGKETVEVTRPDGSTETVLTYGEYLRRFIDEAKAKGAKPILFTLTPRNQREADGSIRRKSDSFNPWIQQVAKEKKVPVVDLEDISARDFESWSSEKVDYMFYNDNIHSSAFGAAHNAWCAARGIAACKGSDLGKYLLPLEPPTLDIDRSSGRPALIVTGDSTIQNTDSDPDGMWGWGSVLETVFDTTRIIPVNAGKAGRSARTFLDEGRWDRVYHSIRPGDFVVIQFGHNDMGPVNRPPFRAELPGDSDDSENIFMPDKLKYQVIYSYGWYLRKFIDDVREKGGIPILVSLTPRNEWPGGRMERRDYSYGIWVRDVVKRTGVDFIDRHNITADYYDSIGPEATKPYYKNDHTHTSRLGAERNARSFAEGLRKAGHPLANYLK